MTKTKIALWSLIVFFGVAFAITTIQPYWIETVKKIQISANQTEQQKQIIRATSANIRIDEIISQILDGTPSAARIRVSLIHKGADGVLRFDVTHAATKSDDPGEILTNVPLTQWSPYLASFLNNQCVVNNIKNEKIDPAARIRLLIAKNGASVGCPILSKDNHLLGAIFLSWDDPTTLPADTKTIEKELTSAAQEMSALVPLL